MSRHWPRLCLGNFKESRLTTLTSQGTQGVMLVVQCHCKIRISLLKPVCELKNASRPGSAACAPLMRSATCLETSEIVCHASDFAYHASDSCPFAGQCQAVGGSKMRNISLRMPTVSTRRVLRVTDFFNQKYFKVSQYRPNLVLLQKFSKLSSSAICNFDRSPGLVTPYSNLRWLPQGTGLGSAGFNEMLRRDIQGSSC